MGTRILTRALAAAALVAGALALVVPATGGADPGGGAFVLNKPDGGTCEYTSGDNVYDGPSVTVVTPNGKLKFTCTSAELVEGPGVARLTHAVFTATLFDIPVVCKGVETPSGHANVICRRSFV